MACAFARTCDSCAVEFGACRLEVSAVKLIEGLGPGETLKGKRVVILEDVTTTGGSSMKAIEAVRRRAEP